MKARVIADGPVTVVVTKRRPSSILGVDDTLEATANGSGFLAGLSDDPPPFSHRARVDWTDSAAVAAIIDGHVDQLRQPWQERLDAMLDANLIDPDDPSLIGAPPINITITDYRGDNTASRDIPLTSVGVNVTWSSWPPTLRKSL